MAKAKSGAKKAPPAASKLKSAKAGVLDGAKQRVVKTAAKLATKAAGLGSKLKSAVKVVPPVASKTKADTVKTAKAAPVERKADRPRPKATKLPPVGQPLTKRELEQLLTAGQGRGVMGEGSLKGRLVVTNDLPHLIVVGRDKRELTFLLQGPDQEVLPSYLNHKVSVSGMIRKTTNYGGAVDVRKFSAKKPEAEVAAVPEGPQEAKLRYLSPGEVAQATAAGMGAGMKGFASIRGSLEMTGDDFVLVVSNGGTRQQVSFILDPKGAKGLRKHVGHTLVVTGVVDKASGWGGKLTVENFELRPAEFRAVDRDQMDVVHVNNSENAPDLIEVKLNHGLTVNLEEKVGFTWAIEPTTAKRVGLREALFHPSNAGPANREFFFTPRNPGSFEVEFFLAKAFTPAQVARSFKLNLLVKA